MYTVCLLEYFFTCKQQIILLSLIYSLKKNIQPLCLICQHTSWVKFISITLWSQSTNAGACTDALKQVKYNDRYFFFFRLKLKSHIDIKKIVKWNIQKNFTQHRTIYPERLRPDVLLIIGFLDNPLAINTTAVWLDL